MKLTLLFYTDAGLISLVLFILMLISTWVGVKIGQNRRKHFDAETKNKEYIEARINYADAGADIKNIMAADSLSKVVSARLWDRAAQLSHNPANGDATLLMIPALNEMLDITTATLFWKKCHL